MPAVTRERLTKASVERAKPQARAYWLRDAEVPGLALRVTPTGSRRWFVLWGRGQAKGFGEFPVMPLEQARNEARKLLVEVQEHGAPASARRSSVVSLRDFIANEFMPWAEANLRWGAGAAERILSRFQEFADRPLATMTAHGLERWRTARLREGVTPNTCNRDLATLKSALKRAVQWGYLESDPLASVKQAKVDSTVVRFLSDKEEKSLRAALAARDAEARAARDRANAWRRERGREEHARIADNDYSDHLTPAVLLSLNTGLRRGELTALTWGDIDLKGCILTVRAAAAKSGRMRRIPLNAEAVAVLSQWRKQTKGSAADRPFQFADAKTAWATLLAEAGIENFRWHDMRHHFASRLVMAGVDLNTVRELMGHADMKMTLRYAHLCPSHLAAAVARLDRAA